MIPFTGGGIQQKPHVGLVLMRAEWTGDQAAELRQQIQASTEGILGQLSKRFNVLGPWVVDSPESLAACQEKAAAQAPDMMLLAFQTWVDEELLASLVESLRGLPLVLWAYLPFRRFPRLAGYQDVLRSSGSVSAFSALGWLRNLRVPFLFTWGAVEDPRLLHDLEVAGRAARARAALREARFGVLPALSRAMQARLTSAERVQQDLGPRTEQVPLDAFCSEAGSFSAEQVQTYVEMLRERYQVDPAAEEALEQAARGALALDRLARDRRLDVLAVNTADSGTSELGCLRPVLYPCLPGGEQGPIYLPQDDLGAAAAAFILHHLTGSPNMLLEFWYWDEALNQVVGGHTGLQNPAVGAGGQVWIRREMDLDHAVGVGGAQFEMVARPGRVTIFQLRATSDGWQAIAATGVALDSRPVVTGIAHVLLRLDVPVDTFLNQISDAGASQHWAMAYGSVLHEIEAFCQMQGISLLMLRA